MFEISSIFTSYAGGKVELVHYYEILYKDTNPMEAVLEYLKNNHKEVFKFEIVDPNEENIQTIQKNIKNKQLDIFSLRTNNLEIIKKANRKSRILNFVQIMYGIQENELNFLTLNQNNELEVVPFMKESISIMKLFTNNK